MNKPIKKTEGGICLIFVSGFPGAGKTTAIAELAKHLSTFSGGVGVIVAEANGASVDAIRLRQAGWKTEVLDGGMLEPAAVVAAAKRLKAAWVIVEAPGCAAQVSETMKAISSPGFNLAPLTVVVDAARAEAIFKLVGQSPFSDSVSYLYRKQIEEGTVLLIHLPKRSGDRDWARVKEFLKTTFPYATLVPPLSSGSDADTWKRRLDEGEPKKVVGEEMDRGQYETAVRALAVLNATVQISSVRYVDANRVLLELAGLVQGLLKQESIEIAHLKMIMTSDEPGELTCVHATGTGGPTELLLEQGEPMQRGELAMNLKAEGDPEMLHAAVNRALLAMVERNPELFARMEESSHFRTELPN